MIAGAMYYNKYPFSHNFRFISDATVRPAATGCSLTFPVPQPGLDTPIIGSGEVRSHAGDIHHFTVRSELWPVNHATAGLDFRAAGAPDVVAAAAGDPGGRETTSLNITPHFQLRLEGPDGSAILQSDPGRGFGVCGRQSMVRFQLGPDDRFYGMGEKWFDRLELSRVQTRFWNTDAWGDFDPMVCESGTPDPMYASIPYLMLRRNDTFIGILVNNPETVFMSTGAAPTAEGQIKAAEADGCFTVGCESGPLDLIIILGPSPAELTGKLQRLLGTTPLPPAWALGYHQSRWGYGSREDLQWLNDNLDRHAIPCDGIWLDIDYMDGYRLFTFNPHHFPEPAADIASVQSGGRHVVPILDPGVKQEAGYAVHDSGLATGAFCLNPQGLPYVGLVWPGATVFPDFSTETGRTWWRDHVVTFARLGFHGAWLDMNDPSTGSVPATDMLFDSRSKPHESYHNQYALGMAAATREAFLEARPEERPFLLCRSACAGSGRFTALWTGDNFSSYRHLARAIPTTLNLALSGIPFNGPDVGGFLGDVTQSLFLDWVKACVLFPFFRIHSCADTRRQEPWSFSDRTLEIAREHIRLRYHLRPYLYQLFIRQEATGEPILRPLFHDYPGDRRFDLTADAFMAGPDLLHAPFVAEDATERDVELPEGTWYALDTGEWLTGGGRVVRTKDDRTTPLFARGGAILPWSTIPERDHRWDGTAVAFLMVMAPGEAVGAGAGPRSREYVWDDGLTFGYRNGRRSTLAITATPAAAAHAGRVTVEVTHRAHGAGTLRPTLMLTGARKEVRLICDGVPVGCTLTRARVRIAGCDHEVTVATPETER